MSRWIVNERPARSRGTALWIAVAFLPWGLLVFLVANYGLDVPLIDQWSFVPQIERFYTGTLSFADLWAQHEEHRLIVPRIVMLSLARATGWDVRYELALNLVLATALFFVLVRLFHRVLASAAKPPPPWLWALLSLAVFSLSQWENWLWGWQLQVFLNVLCVALATDALSRTPLGWKEFALAAFFGVIATYSLGIGLLVWPIGFGLIVVARGTGKRKRLLLASWLVLSGAVIWSYLFHFQSGPDGLEIVVTDPIGYLRYVLTYLGSPLASFSGSAFRPRDSSIAAVAGIAAVLLIILFVRRFRPHAKDAIRRLAPFLALGAYALGSGLLAAVARFRFGIPGALASRYRTVSTLFWVGVIGVVLFGIAAGRSTRSRIEKRSEYFGLASVAAIAVLIAVSSLSSIPIFPARRALLLPARAEMTVGRDLDLLKRLHPEVHQVTYGLMALRRLKVSVFRNTEIVRELADRRPRRLERFGQILVPMFRLKAIRSSRPFTLPVRITNPTTDLWSAEGDGTGSLAVHLTYRWIDLGGRVVVVDGIRTSLPHDLRPGETVSLKAGVVPPSLPGHYVLHLTMVQEGVDWFDAVAGDASEMSIEVVP